MRRARRSLNVLRFCFLHCIFLLREHFFFPKPSDGFEKACRGPQQSQGGRSPFIETLDGEDHCENAGLDLSAEVKGREKMDGKKRRDSAKNTERG